MADHYFQFPLVGLSLNLQQSWPSLLGLACLHYGRVSLRSTPLEVAEEEAANYLAEHPGILSDLQDEDQLAMVFSFQRLGVNAVNGCFASRVKEAKKIEKHCADTPYPSVRIRTDIWWKTFASAEAEHPLSLREFSVLCAVYAAIGSKPYAKASLQMLRRYTAGIPREEVFQRELTKRTTSGLVISVKQLRYTLAALEANQFFAKFTFNRGECFYSNKMTRDQLLEVVGTQKLRRHQTLFDSRQADRAASARILDAKRFLESPYRTSTPTVSANTAGQPAGV